MAHKQSMQFLSFSFGSGTFVHKRLAQGLNKSLSAINQLTALYAKHTTQELLKNIELVFQRFEFAGLKLSKNKCMFGQDKIDFVGRRISKHGIAPFPYKIDKIITNLKLPTSVKSLERYIEFAISYTQNIPRSAEKLILLYQLLQKDDKFQLTQMHKDAICDINKNLIEGAKLSLRLPLSDQQLVIMCDAGEQATS